MPLVECEICKEEYSNVEDPQIPRVLQCGHSVCLNCASQLIKKYSIVCPFCRGVTNIRKANDLQKNFSLVQAIELLKTKSEELSSSPPRCTTHQYNLAEFVCVGKNCSSSNRLMCRTCEDFGAHKGHEKSLLQSEVSKLGEQLSSRNTQLDEQIAGIQTIIEALNTAQLTNMEGGEVYKGKLEQISLHYSTLREYLNEQENREIQNLKKLARENFLKNEKMLIESKKRFEQCLEKRVQMNVLLEMSTVDLLANSSVLEGLGSSWEPSELSPASLNDVTLPFTSADTQINAGIPSTFPSYSQVALITLFIYLFLLEPIFKVILGFYTTFE